MPTRYSDDSSAPASTSSRRSFAGTMFAALYGELLPHPWRGPSPEQDAFSLFVQHASAMGWTSESNGLWEMNDAGWDHPRADRAVGLVSWFQVDAASPEPAMPLPVQPFLRCATEVTARAGALDLMTVQVLMPVGGLAPHARPRRGGVPSMRTARWFGEASPAARTRVNVTIDVGADGANAVQRLGDWLLGLEQQVFHPSVQAPRPDDEWLPPPFDEPFWSGPSAQRVEFAGDLTEWSADAIGWLAEVMAEGVAQLGGDSPILATTTRLPG